jgi:hypothetical protein
VVSYEQNLSVDMVDTQLLDTVIKTYNDELYNSSQIDLSQHLKSWSENKNHLFQLFGNKLKVSVPVETQVTSETIAISVRKFNAYTLGNRKEFALIKYVLAEVLSHEEVATNLVSQERTIFQVKFTKGMKLSKMLGRLCPAKFVNEFQTEFSKLVQSFKVSGTAVLSIDPVDYLTMSSNTSGWRSCHALDGEYRTGTLAYMMDSATVISYVTHRDIEDMPGVADKIWRQVVYFQDDLEFAIQARQYPNKNGNNTQTVRQLIADLLNDYKSPALRTYVTTFARRELLEDLCYNNEDGYNLWYNDIISGSFNTAGVIYDTTTGSAGRYYPDELDYSNTKVAKVGVKWITCICGCGNELTDPNYLTYESYLNNNDDYDDEDYDEDGDEW